MGTLKSLDVRRRIEDHFAQYEIDVVVRQRRNRYVVMWQDDREPIARLSRTGDDDRVSLEWWNGDKWRPHPSAAENQTLDDALIEITADSEGVFGIGDDEPEFDDWQLPEGLESEGRDAVVHVVMRMMRPYLMVFAVLAGAVGGVFSDTLHGVVIGPVSALLGVMIVAAVTTRAVKPVLVAGGLTFIPVAVAGGAGAVIGSSMNQLAGGGVLGLLGGLLGGVTASLLFFRGRWLAVPVSLAASVLLGLRLTAMLPWDAPSLKTAAVAVFAVAMHITSDTLGRFLAPLPVNSRDDESDDSDE